jgi:peptidoglycan/xylan/chitin deacetylase (PgdA/CDA1 family)
MMSIGLHLRIIGRPARMAALDRVLRHITSSGVAWIAPRVQIAKHWLATFPDKAS